MPVYPQVEIRNIEIKKMGSAIS